MDWATIAVLGTMAIGLVNIIDSHLVSRRMPSFSAFLLAVAAFISIPTLGLMSFFPLPPGLESWPLLVALGSGLLRTISILILLYIYKTEEVSQAIPVFHTFPVFVALLAVPLLGETLSGWQWLAVWIVVAGAVIISARRIPGAANWLGRPFWLLTAASLLMALADVGSKYALGYVSFWNIYWLGSLITIAVFLAISLRPPIVRQLLALPRRKATMSLVAANELVAVIGILMIFRAMESGPVSLVATINGSRPLFVLILALLLSRLAPGFLLEGQPAATGLSRRLIATLMIVGGITIIYAT